MVHMRLNVFVTKAEQTSVQFSSRPKGLSVILPMRLFHVFDIGIQRTF